MISVGEANNREFMACALWKEKRVLGLGAGGWRKEEGGCKRGVEMVMRVVEVGAG